jgi:hypothetical protein
MKINLIIIYSNKKMIEFIIDHYCYIVENDYLLNNNSGASDILFQII